MRFILWIDSVPELDGVPPPERRRIVQTVYPLALAHWLFWVALIPPMAALLAGAPRWSVLLLLALTYQVLIHVSREYVAREVYLWRREGGA